MRISTEVSSNKLNFIKLLMVMKLKNIQFNGNFCKLNMNLDIALIQKTKTVNL